MGERGFSSQSFGRSNIVNFLFNIRPVGYDITVFFINLRINLHKLGSFLFQEQRRTDYPLVT